MIRLPPSLRRPPGVLAILAGFLFLSALLRIATGAGAALASVSAPDAAPGIIEAGIAAPSECGPEPSAALLEAFRQREQRLDARESQIAARAEALAAAETALDAKLAELAAAEADLAALVSVAETASETDISQLVAVYEAMKPADASALFEEMAPQFAAGFLGRMRPEAAAAILSGLQPTTAYSISVILAGRNANAPTN